MRDFPLGTDEVADLPVDELALAILRDVEENNEWNSYNWMNKARQAGFRGRALRAVAEAWQWLYTHNLVARDPEQSSSTAIFVTRLGEQALRDGLAPMYAAERLTFELHPLIEQKVRRQFLMGEYELAAFTATKAVEVRVRELARREDGLIGVKLMRAAFGEQGELRDPNLDGGEQTAYMELFAGAIGVFKNPSSHRMVSYEDPTEAAEVILLGDLLLRLLDRQSGAV